MSARKPIPIAEWRSIYHRALLRYASGGISRGDAGDLLIRLGYRSEALRIELLEFDKFRRQHLWNRKMGYTPSATENDPPSSKENGP